MKSEVPLVHNLLPIDSFTGREITVLLFNLSVIFDEFVHGPSLKSCMFKSNPLCSGKLSHLLVIFVGVVVGFPNT